MKTRRLAVNTTLLASGAATILAVKARLRLVSSGSIDGETTLLTEFDSISSWRSVPGALQITRTTAVAPGPIEVPEESRSWHAGPDPEVEEVWGVTAAGKKVAQILAKAMRETHGNRHEGGA